jgi:hypothetical protein
MKSTTVKLLHAYPLEGNKDRRIKQVSIRELRGADEEMLTRASQDPAFSTAMDLLARLVSPGEVSMSNNQLGDLVKEMSIGDRTRLMLELYRLCAGNLLDLVVTCPMCKKDMSIEVQVDNLLQDSRNVHADDGNNYEKNYENQDEEARNNRSSYSTVYAGKYRMKLRPMTGADQERYFGIGNKGRTIEEFLRMCIVSSQPPLSSEPLGDEIMSVISAKLDEMDPLADPNLDATCPSCGHAFLLPLDAERIVLESIRIRTRQFENEIHWLAFYYHWSEESIMSLPVTRRKHYISLIRDTVVGELSP